MRHAVILLSIVVLFPAASPALAQAPADPYKAPTVADPFKEAPAKASENPADRPADPYQKPAAAGGSVDPYSRTMVNTKPATGQAAVKPWEGSMTVDEAVTRKNRLSGGHLFAAPALFRAPLLTSRFGFSQGFAMITGSRTVAGTPYQLTAVGAHENISAAGRILSWLGLDFDFGFDALAGITAESALAMGGITNVDLSIGPVFTLPTIKATNTTFSIGTRLVAHVGLQISPIGGINAVMQQAAEKTGTKVDDSVKGQLVTAASYSGFRPSIGIVQPVFKWGGVQLEGGFARLAAKRSRADGKGDESQSVSSASVGAAFSLDGRQIFNFPLIGVLEYYGDGLNTEKRTTIGAGLYYQGLGEIQLGAFIADTIAKDPEIANYNSVVGQMTMIYYF